MMGSTALAQVDVATDTELRVAYCLGALEAQIAWAAKANQELRIYETKDAEVFRALDRADAEKRARTMDYLNARRLFEGGGRPNALNGIAIAKRRGFTDVERLGADGKCDKCSSTGGMMMKCVEECRREDPTYQSVQRCNENNPLPY